MILNYLPDSIFGLGLLFPGIFVYILIINIFGYSKCTITSLSALLRIQYPHSLLLSITCSVNMQDIALRHSLQLNILNQWLLP